jgi:hypothetical protein
MLLRVRDFGKTHPTVFPESSSSAHRALAAVTSAIDEIETHETARKIAARDTRRDQAARRAIILDRMRAIVRTSKRIVVDSGASLGLVMPRRVGDTAIAEAARRFAMLAEDYQAQFVSLGLPPSCLSDLRAAMTAFEAALSDRRVGRSGIAADAAANKAALAAGSDAARTLDVVVRNTAGQDGALLAAWNRDRRLVGEVAKSDAHVTLPETAEPLPKAS